MAFAAEAYSQGEAFQLEKRRLFATAWLPFCASGQLGATGAFVTHTMGGWPLVAIRGPDGLARGFRNVCRHQGMPVVERPAGTCEALRCRYHGWTYGLDGSLVSAPPLVAPEDPGAPQHRLDALELAEQAGMIHLRGRAGRRVDAEPAELDLGETGFRVALSVDLDANWKTVVELLAAEADVRLVWPIAVTVARNGITIVRQVVPRSFTRTRLVDLVFAAAAADHEPARAALAADAPRLRADATALQSARAAGNGGPVSPAVEAFRARLADALAPG